jgi:hypothetical protein
VTQGAAALISRSWGRRRGMSRRSASRLVRLRDAIRSALEAVLKLRPDDYFCFVHTLPLRRSFIRPGSSASPVARASSCLSCRVSLDRRKRRGWHAGQLSERMAAAQTFCRRGHLLYELPGANISFGRGLASVATSPLNLTHD